MIWLLRGGAAKQKGEKHGGSKLTNNDIYEIRASNETPTKLAPIYNVSPSLISQIHKRKVWKHI